jgi:branched-chain amino acid transport system ATP-binding protein
MSRHAGHAVCITEQDDRHEARAVRESAHVPVAPRPEAEPATTLSLRKVTKRYGGVVAVDDVSFDVARGELLGVIGPNGAGKSTLLSLIKGARRPTSGEIVFEGEHRIDRMRAHSAARLGISRAHQIPRPFGRMTVRENLLVAAHSIGSRSTADVGDVSDVLELCGLADRAEREAGTLPLLDLKRLEVARALALQPRLLLLDEVAAGLVAHEIDEITELIDGVHGRGVTIILVEHVQALVQALAERVIVLNWGRQIAEGSAREIAENPEVVRVYLGTGAAGVTRRDPVPSGSERPIVLQTAGLCVDYGKLRALRSVDFELREGEIAAVLGANGAGKTSLARAIAGLVPCAEGRIVLGDEDVTRQLAPRRARKGIALCHEGRRLFSELKVRENLDLAAYSGVSTAHRDELFERVYNLFPLLRERENAYAGELSGGQQQMVAIARALLSDPRIVMFDELSLGLAPQVVDQIYLAVDQIRSWGVSIVLIEQSAYRALAVADRVYVIERGQVSFSGVPHELEREQDLRNAYFGTREDPKGPQRAVNGGSGEA